MSSAMPVPTCATSRGSTPVECGRSRETVKRSERAGWAAYGNCASHSRFFWGLRLPIAFGERNYFGRGLERELSEDGAQLLRPDRKGERERPGAALFKPSGQVVESINETSKGQLDLERHRGRTPGGVIARVMQRILALTAAIWHNDAVGESHLRTPPAVEDYLVDRVRSVLSGRSLIAPLIELWHSPFHHPRRRATGRWPWPPPTASRADSPTSPGK